MSTRYDKLFSLHPDSQEFADERDRLISEALDECTPEFRNEVFALQAKLDFYRITNSQEKFFGHLVSSMSENVKKLEEAVQRLKTV